MAIIIWLLIVAALMGCAFANPQDNPACKTLTDETGGAMTRYVRKLAKLPAEAKLDLARSSLEGDTCYRRLEFSVGGQAAKMTLYLSPDQRFLSPQLFDSHVDPADREAAEASRISGEINSYLAAHARPSLGEKSASTTIAVFSDFQCPYCKKAMQTLTKEVFVRASGRVRIAYLHFPLPCILGPGKPLSRRNACRAQRRFGMCRIFCSSISLKSTSATLQLRLATISVHQREPKLI